VSERLAAKSIGSASSGATGASSRGGGSSAIGSASSRSGRLSSGRLRNAFSNAERWTGSSHRSKTARSGPLKVRHEEGLAASLRWTRHRCATSPGKGASQHTDQARLTSSRARRHALRDARAASPLTLPGRPICPNLTSNAASRGRNRLSHFVHKSEPTASVPQDGASQGVAILPIVGVSGAGLTQPELPSASGWDPVTGRTNHHTRRRAAVGNGQTFSLLGSRLWAPG
jgi:hypothetical protein